MTQEGTTCLLSGILSRSESGRIQPSPLSGGLHASASLGSSVPLSISLPARPHHWDEGMSETSTLDQESSEPSATVVEPTTEAYSATEYAVNNPRHVFISPRSEVAAACTPDEGCSTDMSPVVPKLNLCLAGLSPLEPEELPQTLAIVHSDVLRTKLQPGPVSSSSMDGCSIKYADVSEQFACGPISSSYIESGDGHPVEPNTARSVSGSVVDSFQTLASDGKVSCLNLEICASSQGC